MPSKDTQFKPGKDWKGNKEGRPMGKTLKEFARQYLLSLPDEDKTKFLNTMSKDIVWRMAEGNPHQSSDMEVSIPQNLIDLLNGTTHSTEDSRVQTEDTE